MGVGWRGGSGARGVVLVGASAVEVVPPLVAVEGVTPVGCEAVGLSVVSSVIVSFFLSGVYSLAEVHVIVGIGV